MTPAPAVTSGRAEEPARLRFRVVIDGRLADEAWLDAAAPGAHAAIAEVSHRHAQLAAVADEAGLPWLAEVYDPDKPTGRAYTRWGTDAAGMTEPAEVPAALLGDLVLGLFDGSPGMEDDGGRR